MTAISSPVGATIHPFANDPTMVKATGNRVFDDEARIKAANAARHGKHPLAPFRRKEIWRMMVASGLLDPGDYAKWDNMTKDDLLLHTQTMDVDKILPPAVPQPAPADSEQLSEIMKRLDALEADKKALEAENAELRSRPSGIIPPSAVEQPGQTELLAKIRGDLPGDPMPPPDFSKMKRADLMRACAATGIKVTNTDKKEDLIRKIENAANPDAA